MTEEHNDIEDKPKNFFSRLTSALRGKKDVLKNNLVNILTTNKISDDLLEEIETELIMADIGVHTTQKIIDQLKEKRKNPSEGNKDLRNNIKDIMLSILEPVCAPLITESTDDPFVILMIGVNGAGKTTSIGKLSRYFKDNNQSVILAAGDTFRAAAIEQLQVWGQRNKIEVIAQETGADPGAVIFDAHASAKAKKINILLADTAGRLHTQIGLMDELVKIKKILKKQSEAAPHEIMLVLDASLGQNALIQAEKFNEALGVTGLIITKLDGSAKGGIVLGIADKLKIPIRFIGIGEKIEDMQAFDRYDYVNALLNLPKNYQNN
jgi:fused signal recognition particle receptor|tara:strand:+ start:21930 stop:22898 length:969 start_codon:yes stop_codon:yes gene_type:complete